MQHPPIATATPSLALALLAMAAVVTTGGLLARHRGGWGSHPLAGRVVGSQRTGWPEGLPALALILLAGGALLVLVIWALGELSTTEPVQRLDQPLYHWFVGHRSA